MSIRATVYPLPKVTIERESAASLISRGKQSPELPEVASGWVPPAVGTCTGLEAIEIHHHLDRPAIVARSLEFRLKTWCRRSYRPDGRRNAGMVQTQVTVQGWLGSTPEGRRPQIRGWRAPGARSLLPARTPR